jgi:hypothetical protein
METASAIDISEKKLRQKGNLLDALLIDNSTKKNITWGTDSYLTRGKEFAPKKIITPELVTGIYDKLIQPRAAKSMREQRFRTKEKAEVFTPLKTVDQMNKLIDWSGDIKLPDETSWQEYVRELKLEISCGEAPFIVSRYNPTAHTGKLIQLENRVGFLDRKLRAVTKFCDEPKEWLYWAKEAFKASYGYEWQGDNILIARENLLYTLIDYYEDKFARKPALIVQQEFAEIISWNIFQMDGIKYVIPMSCKHETKITPGKISFFDGEEPDIVEEYECEGCKFNRPTKHNGKYVKVMDWATAKPINFVSLATELEKHLEQ